MPEIDYDELRRGSGGRSAPKVRVRARPSSVAQSAPKVRVRPRAASAGGVNPFGAIGVKQTEDAGRFNSEDGEDSFGERLVGNVTEGVKTLAASAPQGLATLGATAWDNTVGNVGAMVARRLPGVEVEDVRSSDGFLGGVGRALVNEGAMEALDEGKSLGDTLHAANPFLVPLGQSVMDTDRRIREQQRAILPGGQAAGDTEYGEAWRNKQLLPLLVEDVGNAAMVTSAAAKPLAAGARTAARATGSSRLAKAAVKVGDVADMSRGIDEAIGKAMFAPITVPAKAAGRVAHSGAARVAGTEGYQNWRNSPVAERVMDRWGFGLRSRPIHQQIADIRETEAFKQDAVLRAARDVADIAGDTPELGFAAMVQLSQVNRLLPDLSKLDEGALNLLLDEDGPLGSFFSDLYSMDQARAGFQLANRLLHDPESVPVDVRGKVDGISDLWAERVLPVMEDHYLSQVGRWDEIHPETAQMLAGDDLLPYEEMRVLADHMETERRLIDARDRAQENVGRRQKKLGVDEALFADPIRVMAERAGDIERAIDDLFATRGVSGVVELLRDTEARVDLDALAESPRPAQMELLRSEVRRQIDARAAGLALGRALPVDAVTDLVADLGLGQVLRGRVRSQRAASRETRAEGVRRQADADTGRLDARIGRLDVKATDLAAREVAGEDLGKAAEPDYDVEAGRRELERRAKARAREERRAARVAAAQARRVGKVEGEARGLARERRLAGRRAQRSNDAETATAQSIAEAQGAAFERGRIEGARMEALSKARRELDAIEAALRTNSDSLVAKLDEARNKIESAPARQRIALQIAARFDEYLTDKLSDEGLDSLTAEQLAAFKADIITGAVAAQDVLDNPGNMKGGKPRGAKARGSAAMAPKATSEFLKEGTSAPLSPPDQALLAVRELERGARTKAAKWVVDEYGSTIADKIPDSDRMSPEVLFDAIEEAGMVAVNPLSMLSPKDGNVPLNQLGPDTILLPRWAMEAWRGSNAPAGLLERALQDWLDRPTRVLFKTPVLALSNAWHAGNAVGNFLIAWAGGVNPAEFLGNTRDALAMVNRARRGEFLPGDAPPRMYGAGLGAEMAQLERVFGESSTGMPTRSELSMVGAQPQGRYFGAVRRGGQAAQRRVGGSPLTERTTLPARGRGALRQTLAHPIQTSYAFNGFIDDFTHAVVYIDRSVKHGMEPDVAMRDALRVAGDFSRLTSVERRFARRVLPFYAWMRHITQLAFRLPTEHPLRTAWTLHLWTMMVPDDQDLYEDIPMVAGSLPMGGDSFGRLAPLFPFGAALDVTEGGITDPLAMIGASANPLPRLLMEGVTGVSYGPGGLQLLSRPFGTGSVDAFGSDKLGPIGWGPFAHRALGVLPQTRGIRELLRDKDDRVARYDTGQAVTKDGATIPDVNRRDAGEIIARDLLRLPVFPAAEYDVDAIRARRDEKARRRDR